MLKPVKGNLWDYIVDSACLRTDCGEDKYIIVWDGKHRVPMPFSSIGGYTAGEGIEISDSGEISVDPSIIKEVNDATITIKQEGTTKGTFTLNQAGDATIELDGADLSDYYNKTEVDNLLNDKANTSDIPTVNDALITIQKNGANVDTFTLNQSAADTINITLDKNDVGLGNVDNTSDKDKPISDATQAALDEKANKSDLVAVYKYKGSVASASELPTENLTIGDVYNLEDTGMNVAWNGSEWDDLGGAVDLSNYYNKTQTDTLLANKANTTDIKDSTVTIKQEGTTKGTFTLNQAGDATIELDGADLSDYYTKSEVDSKIPTVNDATVTIKQGTATKGTFTLNQAGDTTIQLDEGADGDIKYADFELNYIATPQSGDFVADLGHLTNKVVLDNGNMTLTADASSLKEGMQYVVIVKNNNSNYVRTVTLGTGTSGEVVEVEPGEEKTIVLLNDGNNLVYQYCSCECTGGSGPAPEAPGAGVITLYDSEGAEIGQFNVNQSEDQDITIDIPSAGGDMYYENFNFSTKSGSTVDLGLSTSITPTEDFTVNKPNGLKDGQIYVLRVDNSDTTYTMTLGSGINNPYNVDLTLTANGLDQFVFLAVGSDLELQPEFMTKRDVEQILRDYGLIS